MKRKRKEERIKLKIKKKQHWGRKELRHACRRSGARSGCWRRGEPMWPSAWAQSLYGIKESNKQQRERERERRKRREKMGNGGKNEK